MKQLSDWEREQRARERAQRANIRYAVYPHTVWENNAPRITNTGYVVRECGPAIPYGKMTPTSGAYKTRARAQREADRQNAEFGF